MTDLLFTAYFIVSNGETYVVCLTIGSFNEFIVVTKLKSAKIMNPIKKKSPTANAKPIIYDTIIFKFEILMFFANIWFFGQINKYF